MSSWQGKKLTVDILYTRAGLAQQIWIESEQAAILCDAGDGTLRDLVAAGKDFRGKLKAVVFTHGHFDHMGGLHSLLAFLRMVGRKEPLRISCPAGCTEVIATVELFMTMYKDTLPFELVDHGCLPYEKFRVEDMIVHAYPVEHCGSIEGGGILDPIPAFGYRITCGDETIAITGDTGDCPAVRELVKGADLAIVEATYANDKKVSPDMFQRVHLNERIATEIGGLAKEHLLVHRGISGRKQGEKK